MNQLLTIPGQVFSYSGRMAADNPFTELAHLVDAISQLHREGFGEGDAAVGQRIFSSRAHC